MSLNSDIRDRAYQFFIEEAQELLQVLEEGLLNLKQDRSTARVHELMRAAHSIKGGAASVELEGIKLLAHRLEDFFKALYSDNIEFDSELESLLLQSYDCLRNPLVAQIETGSFDEEAALIAAEPVFSALEIRLKDALKDVDNYIPSSNDLGVDIVSSIFEVDVAQSIEHLTAVLNNPENYEPAEELRSQLDVLAGFAELFNLPGFSEIINTAQTALKLNSDRVLKIIELTIADCTLAKDAVLAGDREQGGEVSPALKALSRATAIEDTRSPETQTNFEDVEDGVLEQFQDNLWSSEPSNEPFIDDIFGNIPEQSETFISEAEAIEEPELNEIFGTIPEQSETFISEAEATEEPELNEIFGTIPKQSETFISEEVEATEEPELNEIFGTIPEQLDSDTGDLSTFDDLWEAVPVAYTPEITEPTLRGDRDLPPAEIIDSPHDTSQGKNIEAAVESIEQIFDRLPKIEDVPPAFDAVVKTSQSEKSTTKAKAPKTKPNIPANLSVRVDLDRLERMNNLIGELTINRNSLALQNKQLQSNVGELIQKFARFRGVTKKLRKLSDRMLTESESNTNTTSRLIIATGDRSQENETEFDSLEMDRYSLLYSSLQEVLEKIVQLEESVEDIVIFAKQSDRTIDLQRQMLGQMRDELMWVRMLPLEQILQRFPRTLRDLSNKYQKPVNLKLIGTGVLVDKAVLEKLYDPLLHLLRNSFDHGIESPEIRRQQGKPETGEIEIHAYYQGNQTVIEVKDDGKGLDLTKIVNKAVKEGLISVEEARIASQEELFALIFEAGFSTADKVSELSGRGVGMNVVRSQLETLKGKITVTSTPGKGTTFTLRLPLTLTIAKLLVCSLGSTAFALPSDSIEEIVVPVPAQIKFSGTQKFLLWNTKLVPIYPLKELLQYNCTMPPTSLNTKAFETVPTPEDWSLPLLLIKRGQQLFALEVLKLVSEQELVIKPFSKALAAPNYTYGCTILSDGTLIPALDGAALIDEIFGEKVTKPSSNFVPEVELENLKIEVESQAETSTTELIGSRKTTRAIKLKTIMVIDDSTALRRTMALSLEKQGYRVIQKKDGKEAIAEFRQNPDIDLIVCDVEMPNMNGFEFLGVRRRDSNLLKVPVIMLTSRSGAKHRNLAIQLGADTYFTKPYIESEFIAEIKKILNSNSNDTNKSNPTPQLISNKTILVIDDSSALRHTTALCLKNKGYRVLLARDGAEGLDLLKNNLQTDLVICDLEMPNMNGIEFLTDRRKETKLTNIPVVMLSSRNSEKHRNLARQLGAVSYFTKPYVEESFIAEIAKIIQKHPKK